MILIAGEWYQFLSEWRDHDAEVRCLDGMIVFFPLSGSVTGGPLCGVMLVIT